MGEAIGWGSIDAAVILTVTSLLILRDLSGNNRPFDWLPIARTAPFIILVAIQSGIVAAALVVLSAFGRASLRYGADALWVSLAGISLLKALPVSRPDGQRLWTLADWLFKKFYRHLSVEIVRQSNAFRISLETTYRDDPTAFMRDVGLLISAIRPGSEREADVEEIAKRYGAITSERDRIEYLASWVVLHTTSKEWARLTRR